MRVIILAAGHGKRMNHELPKPLVPLCGKPMIGYLLDAIADSGVCADPVIVVSPDNQELFREELGDAYHYVVQHEQLGTGHATAAAKELLEESQEPIMVLYGDMPFVSKETLAAVADRARESQAMLTMATTIVPDFEDWRTAFKSFSRVIRDENNDVVRTVEMKDATPEELQIKEVNPAFMCFQSAWLWKHLEKLNNNNAQGEYYLTDLIRLATEEGNTIATVQIEPKEALGINTKEHLALCEEIAESR